ncbi:hypothetical protein QBC47DRAFT_84815 [Echria macrotheca]|uniref:Secreted protein n=1 Tax=Echria macrotheca TaxID=438768 RepID=A0AAJ0F599_9PEZI|nr:hypothetical protein QBC47DRAFT_84815 [Echria macrotheca]
MPSLFTLNFSHPFFLRLLLFSSCLGWDDDDRGDWTGPDRTGLDWVVICSGLCDPGAKEGRTGGFYGGGKT